MKAGSIIEDCRRHPTRTAFLTALPTSIVLSLWGLAQKGVVFAVVEFIVLLPSVTLFMRLRVFGFRPYRSDEHL